MIREFHSFKASDAEAYGVNAAIVLEHLRTWIEYNKGNGLNFKDGRTWTYNSVKAWSKLLPYFTPKQIRKAIDDLVAAGVLLKGNYNENRYDHTTWYALPVEEAICPKGQPVEPDQGNPEAPSGQPLDQVSNQEKKPKGALPDVPLLLNTPEFLKAWADWIAYRKEAKKPVTPLSAAKQFAMLEALGPDRAVLSINSSIQNQWQGLFEPRNERNGNTLPPRPNGRYFEQAGSYAGITDK